MPIIPEAAVARRLRAEYAGNPRIDDLEIELRKVIGEQPALIPVTVDLAAEVLQRLMVGPKWRQWHMEARERDALLARFMGGPEVAR